jgi:hypothetical protein
MKPADFVFPVLLAVLGFALWLTGIRVADQVNRDTDQYDQGAYIGMSKSMKGHLLPGTTDGTRNPLFPWLAGKFANPDSPDFITKGKRLNILLAALGACLIGWAARGSVGAFGAWNLAALSGLGCLLPMGTFFGAEVLFYLFFAGMWVLALSQIRHPKLKTAFLLGVLAGLAYLAKPSTGPFLGVFTVFLMLLSAIQIFWKSRPDWVLPADWNAASALPGLIILFVTFFVIISPRMAMSAKTFGEPFYNTPSFWFWADNWETCVQKYANCTKAALAQMPPEERPTAGNYFRRNSPAVALTRLTSGTLTKLKQLIVPDGKLPWKAESKSRPKRMILPARGWYLVFCGLFAFGMIAAARGVPITNPGGIACLLFGAGVFCLYTFAYGWYHVIGPGARFVMMFYIPLLWSFFSVARAAANSPARAMALNAFHVLLALPLLWRLAELSTNPEFEKIIHAF